MMSNQESKQRKSYDKRPYSTIGNSNHYGCGVVGPDNLFVFHGDYNDDGFPGPAELARMLNEAYERGFRDATRFSTSPSSIDSCPSR